MEKTINRILNFIKYSGMSVRQFDLSIGASNGYTLRMVKNNASVGSDVIEKIIQKYPEINLVWLITGKGPMLIPKTSSENIKETDNVENYLNDLIDAKWSQEKKDLLEEILKEIKENE